MNEYDFRILRDETVAGVRHITAEPSGLVGSIPIDFYLDEEGKIHNLKYERGCHGNLIAVGRLAEGKPAKEIAEILDGVKPGARIVTQGVSKLAAGMRVRIVPPMDLGSTEERK